MSYNKNLFDAVWDILQLHSTLAKQKYTKTKFHHPIIRYQFNKSLIVSFDTYI